MKFWARCKWEEASNDLIQYPLGPLGPWQTLNVDCIESDANDF